MSNKPLSVMPQCPTNHCQWRHNVLQTFVRDVTMSYKPLSEMSQCLTNLYLRCHNVLQTFVRDVTMSYKPLSEMSQCLTNLCQWCHNVLQTIVKDVTMSFNLLSVMSEWLTNLCQRCHNVLVAIVKDVNVLQCTVSAVTILKIPVTKGCLLRQKRNVTFTFLEQISNWWRTQSHIWIGTAGQDWYAGISYVVHRTVSILLHLL